jgi:guanyl-specific ribonuclease Sa
MAQPTVTRRYDRATEEHALRMSGMLGTGVSAYAIYAIDYHYLPAEARETLQKIIANQPLPFPVNDGSLYGNRGGDLPRGDYLEFTVPTPGASNRAMRRLVIRWRSGQVFFTACHYDRFKAQGGTQETRKAALQQAYANSDPEFRNGFYIVTGMSVGQRNDVVEALRRMARLPAIVT